MLSKTNPIDRQGELLQFLTSPDAYPEAGQSVELRETHISWVFLLDRFVYKLKKPVKFDFLDFSTVERRRNMCEAELQLNRRFAPSVYLDVVPIVRNATGQLMIGKHHAPTGSPAGNRPGHNGHANSNHAVVDWLVKMRRLPDDRRFELLLRDESSIPHREAPIDSIATHLAELFAALAPATVRAAEFRARFQHHILDNRQQLLDCAVTDEERTDIELVNNSQLRFLQTHADLFDLRVLDGRIVDGHGDLRPDHIYLYDPPLVIDCIEFNEEYRTNDIADELSFLAVECDRLGDRTVGPRLFAAYALASGDFADEQLIAFYKSYRACVRAKVETLRCQQQTSLQADATHERQREYFGSCF